MKILYLDLGMGAAGDMLAGALLALFPEDEQEKILYTLNHMGLDGVRIEASDAVRCGVRGTHVRVWADGREERTEDVHGEGEEAEPGHEGTDCAAGHHGHEHASWAEILRLIDGLKLPDRVRQDIREVYGRIAEAESTVHGVEVTEVHLHEVGMKDAVMDVAAVSLMIRQLKADRIIASPVRTGYGKVRCAHGILPVPAPATELLLRGRPSWAGDIEGEMCTPTGAALIGHFADESGRMPLMRPDRTGYGMGTKHFYEGSQEGGTEILNCLRAVIGEDISPAVRKAGLRGGEDVPDVCAELSCNIDDMTGEEIAYALSRIRAAGAAEVFTAPVQMKKERPGVLLTALTAGESEEKVVSAIFRFTSTTGIRRKEIRRYVLERKVTERETALGPVRFKQSRGYGVCREKAEYEDLAGIAEREGISIAQARQLAVPRAHAVTGTPDV